MSQSYMHVHKKLKNFAFKSFNFVSIAKQKLLLGDLKMCDKAFPKSISGFFSNYLEIAFTACIVT